MKKTIIKFLFVVASAALGVMTVAHAQGTKEFNKPWHQSLSGQCGACHQDVPPNPAALGQFKCTTCHGSAQAMAEKTAGLGKMNPHTSIHYETNLPCEECHKEHQEPFQYCIQCHKTWPNTLPGASK